MPLAVALALLCASTYTISTLAGGDSLGDGGPATAANLNDAQGVATAPDGSIYIADPANHRVRRVSPAGVIETVAGTGLPGFSGDGGPAKLARMNSPYGIAIDATGALVIADLGNRRVRRIGRDGVITTLASGFTAPRNVAVAADGSIAVSDFDAGSIKRIGLDGAVAVIAAGMNSPAGLAFDSAGALYAAESGAHRIRRIVGGIVTTAAGDGLDLRTPTGLALGPAGEIWIADSYNRRIVAALPGGGMRVVAGIGSNSALATLDTARDVALAADGALVIADGRRVRKLSISGAASVAAGDGAFGFRGDGGPALDAQLNAPSGIAASPDGALYVADTLNHRLRLVSPSGMISTVAGTGVPGFGFDGLTALTTPIDSPTGLSIDSGGTLWFAERFGDRVRSLGASGTLGLVTSNVTRPAFALMDPAGTLWISDAARVARRLPGGALDPVAGLGATTPQGLAADAFGNLYIADTGNHRIRKVSPQGAISTLAMPAGLDLQSPAAVLALNSGAILIADTGNHRIVEWRAGSVEVIAGNGTQGYSGDDGPAAAASLNTPVALAADASGNLYIADQLNHRIRKLTPSAVVVDPITELSAIRVTSAASGATGAIAPGQILSLYGQGLGPAAGIAATAPLPPVLAETEVLFDGVPGRLFYAQDQQINVQAPYALAGKLRTGIEVRFRGERRAVSNQLVARAAPGIFAANGVALALNQDGSLHTASNRAAPGSIIVLFATGEGQTAPEGVDGVPSQWPAPVPLLPVGAAIGGKPAVILYSGGAPGLIGLIQVNARVPELPAGLHAVAISVGSARSQLGVGIWVR